MRKIILIITLVFICAFVHAQDLTVVGNVNVVAPNPVHVGITINVSFTVQNIGTATAGASHTGIYISPNTNTSSGKLLSEISLEPIQPNATSDVQFNYPIPYDAVGGDGTYYVIVKLNDENEISETRYDNNSANTSINAAAAQWAEQNIPYPIIFVHGLASDNTTWNTMITSLQDQYGWSYGGNMNFCLNQDEDLTTSLSQNDYKDHTDELTLQKDDLYTVNFAVNPDGSTPYNNKWESNQAGIVKQGLAIQDAIKHVLAVTGKDKVILVCHSMGGLAAREYLQNPNLYQASDKKKHVAKLVTIGTPHGGSNSTDLGTKISGTDESSEAVRDLRTSYFWSGQQGAYLFNGTEDNDYMKDQAADFYNVDVNCNGKPGDYITGINNKSISTDLTYSCAIGEGNALWGISSDGVVGTYQANINNYLSVDADTFILRQPSSDLNPFWHIEETNQFAGIMRGVDEPSNDFITGHAYSISSGQLYYGNLTVQSGGNSQRDYDSYIINASSNGNLNIQVYNIPTLFFSINVFNSSKTPVYSIDNHGKSYLNVDVPVTKGNYYVVLSGVPDANSYKYAYAFKCTYSASTSYCSGTTNLTATSGSFTDGSGSNNYSNNSDCRWKIQPSGATSISLSFSLFKVSNPGDTVYVYDGGTTTSPLLGKFTGNSLPANVTSTGGTMLVRFSTDAANTSGGWKASYTSVTVPVYCSGTTTLTDATAIFSDGSSTNDYGSNSHCSWLITPAGAYSVTLNFLTFNTEATNDVVNVYDGNSSDAPLLGSFSGNTLPPVITSSGGAMFVEFISNNIVTAPGWSAMYTAYIPYTGTGIVKYENWFDGNYKKKTSISIAPQDTFRLNSGIPTSGLQSGLHSFYIRFEDNNKKWSSVISQFFIKLPPTSGDNTVTGYEYWFDNNYAGKVSQTISRQEAYQLITGINANELTQGLHSFHIRFEDAGNVWSSVISQFIIKSPGYGANNTVTSYEYWFDNNYAKKTSQTITAIQNYQLLTDLNAGALSQGLHSFHIRFKDAGGAWSSTVNQFIVYIPKGLNKINRYEYWFDNKYGKRVKQTISPGIKIYILNTSVSTASLKNGSHTFHIRFRQTNKLWSSVLSQTFKKTNTANIASIAASTNQITFNDNSPLFVYPNPSTGKFAIGIDDDANINSVQISDENGKMVYLNSSLIKTTVLEIDLSNYAAGVYFIEATDGLKKYNKKIVIAK